MKKITTLFMTLIFSSVLLAQLPSGSFFEFEFTGGSLANTSSSSAPNFTGSISSIADRNLNSNSAADITGSLSGANVGAANVNETTLSFWMKHSALSSNERVLQIYGNGGVGYRLQMTGSVLLYNGNVANASYGLAASHQETVNIDDNAWHHIAVRTTLINPNTLEFDVFLDNVLLPNISNTTITLTGPITRFIENGNLVVSPTNAYTGDIDDIYFYKSALTDAQITQIYNYDPCTVNIPDANFKAYLVGNAAINTNGDTEIQCSEASAYNASITCNNLSISNLTGIEAFTALDYLDCSENNISSLDISLNTSLTTLFCDYNSISSLDVSNNSALSYLKCNNNSLNSLSVSNNMNLTDLICYNNTLSSLDVSSNTALSNLQLFYNNLSSLNLSSNTALTLLSCHHNNLTSLDVSSNTALTSLYCDSNNLTSLDVSLNTGLAALICQDNSLTSLNVANGNNSNFSLFNAENNPNLTCIEVDNVAYSTTNWTVIDATASYSTNCSACYVNIPDANFKSYLVGNAAINTNGNTEIECSEASAFNGQINCNTSTISDLTGVEAFTALTKLYCYSNQITSIDVSVNTALTHIVCYGNQLTSLDLSANTALEYLNYNNNQISSIDLSNNTALEYLFCNDNQITSLDLSANTALLKLACTTNQLTSLNLSVNTAIFDMNCSVNQLTSLDVSNNTALTKVYCGDNQITALDLSAQTVLESVFCNNNQLTNLNVANTNNVNMINMFADNNPNLTCIEVDDVAYSNTNWTNIDATASFSLDCSPVLISSIVVEGQNGISDITIQGGTLQMEATILPANADDMTYTWSVNNSNASISSTGILTAIADGTVEVIATANDASGITGTKMITISNQSENPGTGINDLAFENVNVYPNPTNGMINLNISEPLSSVRIMDLTGKTIQVFNAEQRQLDLSNFTAGIYFLEIANVERKSVVKIVKK